MRPTDLPRGTVTFLFTDIEGSTRLTQSLDANTYRHVLERHHTILRDVIRRHGGVDRGTEGDAFFVVFPDAGEAVAAAVDAQRALATAEWPHDVAVRVRMGLHSGAGIAGGDDYIGVDVNRAARIAASGHGGQILLSDATRALAEASLPSGAALRDLGDHRFKDLDRPEHVFQLVVAGLRSEFPPLRSIGGRRGNLPRRLTSFIGRDQERSEIATLLSTSRLVTITGPGGTGKTSLALAVAEDLVADFKDGAWFVALEATTDPDLIPGAALRAMGLDAQDGRTETDRLVDFLRDRQLLLVLDNLEQLTAGAGIVHRLLTDAPDLRVLVASQVPLHIGGEREYPLGPLAVEASAGALHEAGDSPAVQLFVQRARELQPTFELGLANRAAIVALCIRLDGLPLALELAAAQVRFLSPDAILERLDRHLGLLASRRSDIPERQRTLESAVAWSYDLLAEPEQVLLRQLSAFAGGATLEDIEKLALGVGSIVDPVTSLAELVDRSLVQRRAGSEDRYGLLETIRAYAAARLSESGEEADAHRRHAEIYAQLAEAAEPELYRPGRRQWLERLSREYDNVNAALDRTEVAEEWVLCLRIVAAFWRFWQLTGHLDEARVRLDRLIPKVEAVAQSLPPLLLSRVYEAMGGLDYWYRMGEISRIRIPYEKSLQYAKASGDLDRIAWATYNLSFGYDYVPAAVDNLTPDPVRAQALRVDALERFRQVGDMRGVGYTLWAMGGSPIVIEDEPDVLRDRLTEAYQILHSIDEAYGETWTLMSLSMVEAVSGRLDEARAAIAAATRIFVRDGDLSGQMVVMDALAAMAARGGDPRLAVRLEAAGAAARRATGVAIPPIPPFRGPIAEARRSLDAETIRAEEDAGQRMSFEEILEHSVVEKFAVRQDFVDFAAGFGARFPPESGREPTGTPPTQ